MVRYISTAYWYSILILKTGTPYWYSILEFQTGMPYWYAILIRHTGTPYWYAILVFLTGMPYWYGVMVPYWFLSSWARRWKIAELWIYSVSVFYTVNLEIYCSFVNSQQTVSIFALYSFCLTDKFTLHVPIQTLFIDTNLYQFLSFEPTPSSYISQKTYLPNVFLVTV